VRDLKKMQQIVEEQHREIIAAWKTHFIVRGGAFSFASWDVAED